MAIVGTTNPNITKMFRIYAVSENGVEYLSGAASSITLPNIQFITDNITAAGFAGAFDMPAIGMPQATSMTIPFMNKSRQYFSMVNGYINTHVIIRGIEDEYDTALGIVKPIPFSVRVKGLTAGMNLGTLAQGQAGKPENSVNIAFFEYKRAGDTLLLWDLGLGIYKVAGIDMNAGNQLFS